MLKLRKDTEGRIPNANFEKWQEKTKNFTSFDSNEFYFEGSLSDVKAYLKKNNLEFVRYSEYSDTVYYN